jgi:uncharacterized protein YecE (DUF72 family)
MNLNGIHLGTSAFTAAGWEKETKTWDKTIVNRTRELREWVEIVRKVHKRKIKIFAYANNHYAGYAPATIEKFEKMMKEA